jgi:hypothetical protein
MGLERKERVESVIICGVGKMIEGQGSLGIVISEIEVRPIDQRLCGK